MKKVKVPELFRTVPLLEMTKEKVQVTQLLIDLGNRDFMNRLTKCSACGLRRLEINTALSFVINIYRGLFCPMFRRIVSCPQSSVQRSLLKKTLTGTQGRGARIHMSPSLCSDALFFLVLRIFWEEQLAEQFWYFNFSLYLVVFWAEQSKKAPCT